MGHNAALEIHRLRKQLQEKSLLASRRKVEANALLTEYSEWLMKHHYLDSDWLTECGDDQTAVDEFLRERDDG